MNVNMSVQFLIPGVQHHGSRRFELLFVFDGLLQRTPRALKQQVEQLTTISQSQRRQLGRNRKHHLKIVDARQQQLRRRLQPVPSFGTAATGAVPIAARVINNRTMITRTTLIQAPAQRGRAA